MPETRQQNICKSFNTLSVRHIKSSHGYQPQLSTTNLQILSQPIRRRHAVGVLQAARLAHRLADVPLDHRGGSSARLCHQGVPRDVRAEHEQSLAGHRLRKVESRRRRVDATVIDPGWFRAIYARIAIVIFVHIYAKGTMRSGIENQYHV